MSNKYNHLLLLRTLIDHESGSATLAVDTLHVEKENSLETYYAAIGCRAIDIVSTTINGHDVDLIVDDEGLLQEPPEGLELLDGFVFRDDHGNEIPLAGAVIIAGVNEDGETIDPPVTREDVLHWCKTGRIQIAGLPPLY